MTIPANGTLASQAILDNKAMNQMKALSALESKRNDPREEQLREVSRQFAGLFLGEVFKSMRGEADTSGVGFGGTGEKYFQEMTDEAMATEAAGGKSYGLADLVYQAMTRRSQIMTQNASTEG